jgi:hypothetical protein
MVERALGGRLTWAYPTEITRPVRRNKLMNIMEEIELRVGLRPSLEHPIEP